MPYKTELVTLVADWWQFGVFIGGSIIAFMVGKERQRYKVDQVGRDVCGLKVEMKEFRKELSAMKSIDGAEAVQAAKSITELATDIKYLRHSMDDLRSELRRKADK